MFSTSCNGFRVLLTLKSNVKDNRYPLSRLICVTLGSLRRELGWARLRNRTATTESTKYHYHYSFHYYFMVIIPFNTITTVIKEPEDQQRNHRIITNQRTNLENQKRHTIPHHHHHLHRHHHHCPMIFCAQECGAQGWVQPKAVAQDVIIVVASSP